MLHLPRQTPHPRRIHFQLPTQRGRLIGRRGRRHDRWHRRGRRPQRSRRSRRCTLRDPGTGRSRTRLPLLRPIPLTESETGYVVSRVKHVYEQNVVLQFNVENTVDNQRIENVTVILESEKGLFEVTGEIPAPAIKCGGTRTCYTVMGRDVGAPMEIYELTSSLHFNVVQVNPVSGEMQPCDGTGVLKAVAGVGGGRQEASHDASERDVYWWEIRVGTGSNGKAGCHPGGVEDCGEE